MLKKALVIIVLMSSFVNFCQAQDYHIINLLPLEEDTVENVNFYVSKIIDNRIYKDNLGIAQKGVFNKKVLSTFYNPFEEELMDYFNAIFPANTSKTPLVLRINQLLISEHTGAFKETGKATVNLDVLTEKDAIYYFLGSFSAYAEKNSVDVTGKHDDRIREILKSCLIQFSELNPDTQMNRPILIENPSAPVILSEPIKKGFYTSFSELYNNQPFQDASIAFKDYSSNQEKLNLEEREHKRALYYAYSDGDYIYLNASNYSGEKHFVKSELIDKYLLFNDTFVNQDKVAGMSLAFGVLGLLMSNEQTNVLLDLYTGQYHSIDGSKIRMLLNDKYPDLYKHVRKNLNNKDVMKSVLIKLLESENKEEVRYILEAS
ncbi:hypothetical protein ACFQ0I_09375 [Mariniflexile aquimaris]|uniref:DUF4136 domain-containing protein n=1 Tax=Mariniflexile aquimaris TaxID=881009 RepID=A0ABW3BTI1_9FLAO